MAEFIKIENLVSKYRFDDIIDNHLDTLQLLFLALTYGVVPLTQPQREELTNYQRKVIRDIFLANPDEARLVIKDSMQDIVNIFAIIEDSLKLARKSFHKFPLQNHSTTISTSSDSEDLDESLTE